MVRLKIDKHEIEAEVGMTLMEVVDDMYMQLTGDRNYVNLILPRLCNHEALEPYGACRLCLVEVEKKGRSKLETSCNYIIKEDEEITVKTNSPRVKKSRKVNMELLLAKAPHSELLKHMAFQMGVKKVDRYEKRGDNYLENCIDCGICARACEEIVGKSAITLAGKGTDKHVSTPYATASKDCIGCGLCYHLCPTNAINMEEKDGKRTIWGKEFNLVACESCGEYYATEEMIKHKKGLLKDVKLPKDFFTKCQKCYDKEDDEKVEIDTQYVIDIKKDICKDCKRCVDACPKGLLSKTEEFNKKGYATIRWDPVPRGLKKEHLESIKDLEKLTCAGCQACYRACPESSIDIYTKKEGKVKILK